MYNYGLLFQKLLMKLQGLTESMKSKLNDQSILIAKKEKLIEELRKEIEVNIMTLLVCLHRRAQNKC